VIVGAACYWLWPKSNQDWSVSLGVATPIVSNSIASSAETPSPPDEDLKPKQNSKSKVSTQTQCVLGNDRRVLIMAPRSAGCLLSYQSHSRVETVAEATWGKQICQRVRAKIVEKLKISGYFCS
jgi:hypothetical protein